MRVRLRRRSSLPSQTLVLPLQLPYRKARDKFAKSSQKQESRSRNTINVRKKWSVDLPPSNVKMQVQKLRSRILSFENMKGNDE